MIKTTYDQTVVDAQLIGQVLLKVNPQQAAEIESCFHRGRTQEFYQLILNLVYNHYEQDRSICHRQQLN